ncbi:FmdE family protein [Castellaniella caeni]|uniref:FmdE family protein n=1 Tax=Castellaniella caeni TaxID=266123 RepID=UPI000832C7FE|nr:FmdE family protein [Castellaniella caeni]
MAFPAFFKTAPRITLHDPLAQLLGASDDGTIEYGYEDAVRLAGHSCPTVAGAWLMTVKALKALYPDSLPERGNVVVEFADSATNGVTGVIANVVSLVTGSTTDTGFKGLGGQHDRRNLLYFQHPVPGEISFTRRDTGASVAVSYSAQGVPPAPTAMPLLQKIMSGQANDSQKTEFAQLWQDRVRRILEAANQPGLVTVTERQKAA